MIPFDEITEEEEEEILEKIAERIHQHGMEVPAIMLLESSKPVSYIGTQLSRLYLAPIMPLLREDLGIPAEKILQVFEKRSNIEKLIDMIEEKTKEKW